MASEILRVNELVAQQGWNKDSLLYYYERFIVMSGGVQQLVAYLEDCAATENEAAAVLLETADAQCEECGAKCHYDPEVKEFTGKVLCPKCDAKHDWPE